MDKFLRCACSAVLAAVVFVAPAHAEDHGVLHFWCKGSAQDNDDPLGRDEYLKTTEKQGKASIDFDNSQIDFMRWSHIKISEVTYGRIQADQNAFESGTGYHVRIDRMSGEVVFQTLVHDAKTGDTWFSHIFSGKCVKADKSGRPIKSKPDANGF